MSSVIDFLERLGADAGLRAASKVDMTQAVAEASLDAELGAAIIARSTAGIYAKLDVKPMFCVQMEPQREDEDEEEEEGEEVPDEKKKSKAILSVPLIALTHH